RMSPTEGSERRLTTETPAGLAGSIAWPEGTSKSSSAPKPSRDASNRLSELGPGVATLRPMPRLPRRQPSGHAPTPGPLPPQGGHELVILRLLQGIDAVGAEPQVPGLPEGRDGRGPVLCQVVGLGEVEVRRRRRGRREDALQFLDGQVAPAHL